MISSYLCELLKTSKDRIGIYISFSGGFDSTCLILDLLRQANTAYNYNMYNFNIISENNWFTMFRTNREQQARTKIKGYISEINNNPKINIDYHELYLNNSPENPAIIHRNGMILQQIYTFFATLTIDLISNDICYLYMPFICGDQICSFEREIKEICYNCLKIQYSKISMDEQTKGNY